MTDFGHIRLDRSFKIPPARLWHLLTDPETRTKWGAPSPDMILILDAHDLREGGRDRHRCGPAEAPDFVVETQWYRLDAPASACFTETLVIGEDHLSTSLVAYTLTGTPTGCDLAIDLAVASHSGPDTVGEHEAGWTSALENLAAMAEQEAADAQP